MNSLPSCPNKAGRTSALLSPSLRASLPAVRAFVRPCLVCRARKADPQVTCTGIIHQRVSDAAPQKPEGPAVKTAPRPRARTQWALKFHTGRFLLAAEPSLASLRRDRLVNRAWRAVTRSMAHRLTAALCTRGGVGLPARHRHLRRGRPDTKALRK